MKVFVVTTWLILFSFFTIAESHGKFNKREISRTRAKAEAKKNRHNSGIGAIKAESLVVRFLEKKVRRSKVSSCKRKYNAELRKSKRTVKNLTAKRRLYAVIGKWRTNQGDQNNTHTLRFFSHNRSSDFVQAEYIDDDDGSVVDTLRGYLEFNRLQAVGSGSQPDSYYMIFSRKSHSFPSLSGNISTRGLTGFRYSTSPAP